MERMKFNAIANCFKNWIGILLFLGCGCSVNRPAVDSTRTSIDPELRTVVFMANTNTFRPNFEKTMHAQAAIKQAMEDQWRGHMFGGSFNDCSIVDALLRQYLLESGVNIKPPGSIFYNDRLGEVLVRATARECKNVKRSLAVLNQEPMIELPNSPRNQ